MCRRSCAVNGDCAQFNGCTGVASHVGLTDLHGIRSVLAFCQNEGGASTCGPIGSTVDAVFPARASFQVGYGDHTVVSNGIAGV